MNTSAKTVIYALWLCGFTAAAMADGKMFWSEDVPPDIPYQRAILHFRDGVETLILQSKYATATPEANPSLGWVVPVPSEPEVASIHPNIAEGLFNSLALRTRPRVTSIRAIAFRVLFWETAALSVLSLSTYLLLSAIKFPVRLGDKQQKLKHLAERLFVVSVALFVYAFLSPGLSRARGPEGVEVVSGQTVGIYDVKVVRSDDSSELIAWLDDRNFKFGEKDKASFEEYIGNGWCFAVATIAPNKGEDGWETMTEGLAAPLVLRFPHDVPVYPLRLTGTGGFDTEILIYLAGESRMECDDRLTLHFARSTKPEDNHFRILDSFPYLEPDSESMEPKDFFEPGDLDFTYLCKFKGTLTPVQMDRDIVFGPADEHGDYREHIVTW
ncbi:MAG: DUF2330 domain-containing protein [Candidatus Hydrogenedentes bacterium]|nr:DUF2330 domain-containing protein [Candidatus Hydrogenedentota bacterium]